MKPYTEQTIHPLLATGLVLVIAMLTCSPVQAQQWQFEPIIKLAGEYNDNFRLNVDDADEIEGSAVVADVNARFVLRGQTSEIRVAPRIRYTNNSDSRLDDTDDLFFDFFVNSQMQRGEYGIQIRLSQENVRSAEIEDPDFDNPDVNDPLNLDTGFTRLESDRESIVVSPFFDRELTETVTLGVDAEYLDVSYDPNVLTDYTSATLGLALDFKIDERTSWSIRAFGNDYEAEADPNLNESQSYGAELRLDRQFSERLEGWIGAGFEDTDSDLTLGGATTSESNTSTLFSAGLTQRGETSRIVFDVSQSVDPSGRGFLQERSQVRLRYVRQLSPKLFGTLEGRLQRTEQLSTAALQIERDYQRYRAGLEWRVTRSWSIEADYVFTTQEFDIEDDDATSNALSLRVVYQPVRVR